MIITRQLLRKWRACYKDERIAELVPESGLTPIQILELEIPDADRIWGACNVLAREDRPALIALARKWAAAAARWAAADADAARWAAAAADAASADADADAARWAASAAAAAAAAAADAAAARWAARKQQVTDCREALLRSETVT